MANKKISELSKTNGLSGECCFPVVSSGVTKRVDVNTLVTVLHAKGLINESDLETKLSEVISDMEDYVDDSINKSEVEPTVLYETLTEIGALAVAGENSSKTITLTDTVQAGDKLRVYLTGGSSYPHIQAAIIEFELYNPSDTTLAGIGSVMSDTGASIGIISASVTSASLTTSTLKISLYCLTDTVHAAASNVLVSKVERIRSGD